MTEASPPEASFADAQWPAALDAARAAANDAEVAQARAEAEWRAARDALLREAEFRRSAGGGGCRRASRAGGGGGSRAPARVREPRGELDDMEVSDAEASVGVGGPRARRRAPRRGGARARRAGPSEQGAPGRRGTGDDGMPGGAAGDAAGDAAQAARAAGYRAGHADGTREASAVAEAEHEEQMADLLVCLGEEDRQIERPRASRGTGVDTQKVMDD